MACFPSRNIGAKITPFEEFTADHRVPGLIGFTADYIVESAMLFFYEHLSALASLLVILCKLIHPLSFVCTRIRNLLYCVLSYCNRTRLSLRLNELIVIEESCFFTFNLENLFLYTASPNSGRVTGNFETL